MLVARTPEQLAGLAGGVLVPTMGALHDGHASLIRFGAALARDRALPGCTVSIFVNPTQFNDPRDFARYPRTESADLALCKAAGASAVFIPGVETVYPPGHAPPVPPLPPVATRPGLEDRFRPGHFAGVCQVVRRLFQLTSPSAAAFGEKDWQQLLVVSAMTAQQRLAVEVVACPTVREPDGMALSSRNQLLTDRHRAAAASISHALRQAQSIPDARAAEEQMARTVSGAGLSVEYAVVRHAGTLMPIERLASGMDYRSLIAARAGEVRLIDNERWPGPPRSRP